MRGRRRVRALLTGAAVTVVGLSAWPATATAGGGDRSASTHELTRPSRATMATMHARMMQEPDARGAHETMMQDGAMAQMHETMMGSSGR